LLPPPFNDINSGGYNDINIITLRSPEDIYSLASNIKTHVEGQSNEGTVFLVNEVSFSETYPIWGNDVDLPTPVVPKSKKRCTHTD